MACKVRVNQHGFLLYRIHWNGFLAVTGREETREGSKFKDTPENREIMEAQAKLINREIKAGVFNYLDWFPNGNVAKYFREEKARAEPRTIHTWAEQWLVDKKPPFVKKTLARNYRTHLNAHILPCLGSLRLDLLGFGEIKAFRQKLLDRGVSLKTAKNILQGTLRAMFRDAKAEGIIAADPFRDVPKKWWPRTVKSKPADPFTEEERDRILEFFRKRKTPTEYALLCTLFWTGRRPSEIVGRRWRDYDPAGRLMIASSRTEGEESATKTLGSESVIDLLEPVVEAINAIRPTHHEPADYIFKNRAGKPIDQKVFAWRHFWPALRSIGGIRPRDFYCTRDTFISVMLKYRYAPQQIADVCGNSPEIIFRHYAKWIDNDGETFGARALQGQGKRTTATRDVARNPQRKPSKRLVRGAGFEPARRFRH